MAALSVAAVFRSHARGRFAVASGVAIAVASPLVDNLSWTGVPLLLQAYLTPGHGRGLFPFFPFAAYVAFGLAAGTIVKRTPEERFDRIMQWSVLIAFGLIFCGQYFSSIPYSLYAKSSFWMDSPALIFIRVGVALLMLAGAYLWTEYGAAPRWSWMQALGKNSLMVYWVHVMIVYGAVVQPIKRQLSIPQTTALTIALTLAMVALSAAWMWWKARRGAGKAPDNPIPATSIAGVTW
jgi:fucose 4-O-acetylase-like acetyltransferase